VLVQLSVTKVGPAGTKKTGSVSGMTASDHATPPVFLVFSLHIGSVVDASPILLNLSRVFLL